jgi:hypothetical protein
VAALERFAQGFENPAVEFGKLVQKQDPVVCERDLTGTRGAATVKSIDK